MLYDGCSSTPGSFFTAINLTLRAEVREVLILQVEVSREVSESVVRGAGGV